MTDGDNNANQNTTISKLVKSSIEQAQNSHRTYVEMSERVRPDAVDASESKFNEKALDLAKYDTAENFKLALNLVDMTDEQAAISLHDEHTRAQSDEMARRVADLQLLANDHLEISETIAEPLLEPAIADAATPEPSVSSVTQATVSSTALAGGMGTVAATAVIVDQPGSGDPIETADPELTETIAATKEPVSEEHMEAEIEALALKINDVENIETDTPEVREFDSEDVELIVEDSVLEDVPELEIAVPIVEEVAEIKIAAPVPEEVAEVEIAAPVLEDFPELEIAAPVVEEVAEIEIAAPVPEEVAEVEIAAPVLEDVPELEIAAPVADIAAAVPVPQEPAIDPKAFDTDLAARLDAVRAMLQGSAQ
ncbi:MAG: hypothetical protein GY927_19730 [bacterium]|nr:hypothetical protein [bacterium]